jgi:glycosyltransferase involved in cell wall biosynthesis
MAKVKIYHVSSPFEIPFTGDFDYGTAILKLLEKADTEVEYLTLNTVLKKYGVAEYGTIQEVVKQLNYGISAFSVNSKTNVKTFWESFLGWTTTSLRKYAIDQIKKYIIDESKENNYAPILNLQLRPNSTGFLFVPEDLQDFLKEKIKINVTCHEYQLNAYDRTLYQTVLHNYFKAANTVTFFNISDFTSACKHANYTSFKWDCLSQERQKEWEEYEKDKFTQWTSNFLGGYEPYNLADKVIMTRVPPTVGYKETQLDQFQKRAPHIVVFGSIRPEKGLNEILDLAKAIEKDKIKFKDIRVKIIGTPFGDKDKDIGLATTKTILEARFEQEVINEVIKFELGKLREEAALSVIKAINDANEVIKGTITKLQEIRNKLSNKVDDSIKEANNSFHNTIDNTIEANNNILQIANQAYDAYDKAVVGNNDTKTQLKKAKAVLTASKKNLFNICKSFQKANLNIKEITNAAEFLDYFSKHIEIARMNIQTSIKNIRASKDKSWDKILECFVEVNELGEERIKIEKLKNFIKALVSNETDLGTKQLLPIDIYIGLGNEEVLEELRKSKYAVKYDNKGWANNASAHISPLVNGCILYTGCGVNTSKEVLRGGEYEEAIVFLSGKYGLKEGKKLTVKEKFVGNEKQKHYKSADDTETTVVGKTLVTAEMILNNIITRENDSSLNERTFDQAKKLSEEFTTKLGKEFKEALTNQEKRYEQCRKPYLQEKLNKLEAQHLLIYLKQEGNLFCKLRYIANKVLNTDQNAIKGQVEKFLNDTVSDLVDKNTDEESQKIYNFSSVKKFMFQHLNGIANLYLLLNEICKNLIKPYLPEEWFSNLLTFLPQFNEGNDFWRHFVEMPHEDTVPVQALGETSN